MTANFNTDKLIKEKADLKHLNECYYRLLNAGYYPCPDSVYLDWCSADESRFSSVRFNPDAASFTLPPLEFASEMPAHVYYGVSPSPYGYCVIAGFDETLVYLVFNDRIDFAPYLPEFCSDAIRDDDYALETAACLFGQPSLFKPYCRIPEFQKEIYRAQTQVPPGAVVSYKHLCEKAGYQNLFRQTGRALSINQISFLIPCHRTIGSDGGLCGYGGGLTRKKLMLARENLLYSK